MDGIIQEVIRFPGMIFGIVFGTIFEAYKQYVHTTLKNLLPSNLHKYLAPIEILGIAAAIVFGLGRIFDWYFEDKVERGESSVLEQALPFTATFITILLIFILLIFIVALRFNGKMPYRTYRPVELTIIGGIGAGIFAIFQPWEITSYKYGFLLLLGSTISFILWSHVRPQNKKRGDALPPFNGVHHALGLVLAVLVLGSIVFVAFNAINPPEEPYGYSDRIWSRGLREEQRVAVAEQAEHNYDTTRFSIALMSLLPAFAAYCIGREVAANFLAAPSYPATSPSNIANAET
jgi:hypothetical protein